MSSGNLSRSMRANYAEHGVSEYYTKVGKTYRNPHFSGVKACLFEWMNKWWKNEKNLPNDSDPVTIFDMACGSGEATICVLQWYEIGRQLHKRSLQFASGAHVVTGSPLASSYSKTQPHPALCSRCPEPAILAADPFTVEAYKERTGMACTPLSFRHIVEGAMPPQSSRHGAVASANVEPRGPDTADKPDPGNSPESREIEMVICSFALHLIESPSELFSLLWELSTKAKWLVVLAPHKKPEIKDGWGWTKWDVNAWNACRMSEGSGEILKERVHCRVYKSLNYV
ncbi:hypothetical protein DFH11DRAFT_173070 [Phellopilus nigrolimitatus]|nr:hypothetical protein DFH11DRAFT_173070 [Phellopilus nigrolimitatus]